MLTYCTAFWRGEIMKINMSNAHSCSYLLFSYVFILKEIKFNPITNSGKKNCDLPFYCKKRNIRKATIVLTTNYCIYKMSSVSPNSRCSKFKCNWMNCQPRFEQQLKTSSAAKVVKQARQKPQHKTCRKPCLGMMTWKQRNRYWILWGKV